MLSETDLELLSSYLDGALSDQERVALEARLQSDADLRRELARLRATVDLVKMLPTLAAPRNFTLTPRMVRRPSIITSAAFSALSAAAAVILLVIGVTLFSTRPARQNAVLSQVAFAATNTTQVTQAAEEFSGGAAANAPSETLLKQSTETELAPAPNDLLAAPTEPPAILQFSLIALPTETPVPTDTEALDAARTASGLAADQQSSAAPAPLAMNGALPQAQAPLQAEAALATFTATDTPTSTPTLTATPTTTSSPTDTATLTNTPSSTPTSTMTPTPAPTPIPPTAAAAETNPLGVGLIVLALGLLGVAVVTTILRRRA